MVTSLSKVQTGNQLACLKAHDHQGLFDGKSLPTCSVMQYINVPAPYAAHYTTFSTSPFEWKYGGGAALRVGKPIDKRALIISLQLQ
jgi:hypothetical protein